MNFKTLILLSLILLGGICTGCDRFLDVQPKDQYTEKQLLATRGGYYTAMNGLYNNLTSNSLYGKNLSYELIDVISKRYAPLAKSTYLTSLNSWGYAEENVSKALESTWATAYTTILNCNVILENLATQQGILSPAETNLMKGELLALRAFLHFDMLRLFGPIYKEDPSAPSIPYNESVKIMNLPLLSADSIVHNKIMRDLDEAEKLLAKDPVIPEGPMASALEDENEVYLRYRQLRMNYYAVLALKARVYLYAGEKDKALQAAYKLLKDKTVSEWFPPVDPNKLLANNVDPDRVFSTEVLMGIYMKNGAISIPTVSMQKMQETIFYNPVTHSSTAICLQEKPRITAINPNGLRRRVSESRVIYSPSTKPFRTEMLNYSTAASCH